VKIAATGPIGEDIGPTSSHVLDRVVGLIFHPVAFHVDFFFSCSLIFQKNDVEKILGPFDVHQVPESKKTCKNKKIRFTVLFPNERGLFRKSPD
jgi:hypothetical protein